VTAKVLESGGFVVATNVVTALRVTAEVLDSDCYYYVTTDEVIAVWVTVKVLESDGHVVGDT
jgi:hypothetical protein